MVCRKCKAELPGDAIYCMKCGSKQDVPERKPKARGNGQGTVYRRGDVWYAESCRYIKGVGRIRKKKGGFLKKKDALDYLRTLADQTTITHTKSITFAELYNKVKETERYKKLSDSKKTAWRIAYNRCAPLLLADDYRDIRFENMQSIVRGLTFYPARDVKILLNAMSTLAMKYELCETNFAELIELPENVESEKVVLTDEELEKLWKYADKDPFTDYILIMCYIGLRPIELRSAHVSDIHMDERYMMGGKKTKLSKESPIGIGTKIAPVMQRVVDRATTDKLCDMSEDDFYEAFYTAMAGAGIQEKENHRITPVCCRHTFVTNYTRTGAAPAVIQKAARHTKYQTTLGYTHMDISDVLESLDKM